MKKKFVFVIALCILCFAFSGCGKIDKDTVEFSLVQKEVVSASDDNFFVSIVSGARENPFVIDGETKNNENFTTLTALPLHFDLFDKTYTFTVQGDKGSYEGKLEAQKTGSGYSADIKTTSIIGNILSVEIKDADNVYTFAPTSKMGEFTYMDAYEKAKETFASTLEKEKASGTKREIVVKYISDGKNDDSSFYWYVAFMKSDADFLSVLLDGKTGKIIAQRG